MKKTIILTALFLIIYGLLFLKPCLAAQPVDLYFFYDQTCPACTQAQTFLGELARKYPGLKVKNFEIFTTPKNQKIYFALGQTYNLNLKQIPTPVMFISERAFTAYSPVIASTIEQIVIKCLAQGCASPIEKLQAFQDSVEFSQNNQTGQSNFLIWVIVILFIFGLIFLFKKRKV